MGISFSAHLYGFIRIAEHPRDVRQKDQIHCFQVLIQNLEQIAMAFFGVERQHPIGMLPGLEQLAEPKIGVHRSVMPEDQHIRVVVRLGGVLYFPDPAQQLGIPPTAQHVDVQSP